MRYPLFSHTLGDDLLMVDLTTIFCLDDFEYAFVISQGVGVHRSLRHESIWQGNVDYPSYETCASE